jgi:hypothetical protein
MYKYPDSGTWALDTFGRGRFPNIMEAEVPLHALYAHGQYAQG